MVERSRLHSRPTARAGRIACALLLVLAAALAWANAAGATEPIESFETFSSTSVAGGHPDLTTKFTLANPGLPEAARNVAFNAPQGVFGNPNAVGTRCTSSDFALMQCPTNTQIGLITVYAKDEAGPHDILGTAPIYDIEPDGDQTALFGFIVPQLNIPISIPVTVRTASDYGLRFTVTEITQLTPLAGAELTFWGVPAATVHNGQRFAPGKPGVPSGCVGEAGTECITKALLPTVTPSPLVDNPSVCTGQPQQTTLEVQTYQDPEHRSVAYSSYPPTTGCEQMTFKPVLNAEPTTTATDSASGLTIEMNDPQFLGYAVTPSELKAGILTLPPGFTINPDAADGQHACSDAQANFDTEGPSECPDSAKIGTVAIHSIALEGTLNGSIYLGEPLPNDQYRLFLTVDGFGIHAKLIGAFRPDPLTGQVTAYFENLPQVPFDSFQIHLFSSERGLMATPTQCTVYQISADFVPWNASLADVTSTQFFGLTSGPHGSACPGQIRPFGPRLEAGTSNSKAGAFSSFTLKLDREDGDQFLGDVNFKMPPGFVGALKGLTYCPDAAIAAAVQRSGRAEQAEPSCPASSLVGSTNVAAGPGSHPFHAVGKIYLAGPFKGAPVSLIALTPALAGPYDYGVVGVRVGLSVDEHTAQVSAVSETLPKIIGGIPIRMRSIQVNIDKPNFTVNPTNCSKFSVESEAIGDQGSVAKFSSPFHVDNCAALGFKPRMTVTQLGGAAAAKRNHDPAMQFDLYTRGGDANLKSVAVTLPKSFEIDQRHLGNICSRAQLMKEHCKGRQSIGSVEVNTPLLAEPLKGPAYAVSGYGKLPHLAFILEGQVTLVPEALSASVKGGHLRTTVPVIPDAEIGHFRLSLLGGAKGYLINSRDLCAAPDVLTVEYTGQSGRTLTQRVTAKTNCPKAKAKAKQKQPKKGAKS
jgi:hypothetical protein